MQVGHLWRQDPARLELLFDEVMRGKGRQV
jgi:hypothetical protein